MKCSCVFVWFQFCWYFICVYCNPIASQTKNNIINTNQNNVTNNHHHHHNINNNSTLITDNLSSLHRSQLHEQQNKQLENNNSEWDILYDKEIGTWCQPVDANVPTVSQSASPFESAVNQELQQTSPPVGSATLPGQSHVLTRWVDAALRLVRSQTLELNCTSSDSICSPLSSTDGQEEDKEQQSTIANSRPVASNMNLYVAMVDRQQQQQQKWNQKLEAVLADGGLSKTGAHDAWLVLDPTPQLAFGHTLYVFVVDFNTTDVNCIATGGHPLDGDECMNRVFKNRCANRMMVRRAATASTANWRHKGPHRCDVDFLPLVHLQNKAPLQSEQRLLCTNDVKGLAPCPQLRSWNETSELICDPLSSNHKRCDSTQDVVKTRCRLFETCDQAVLLSGGWNWQMSGEREVGRLLSVYRMLRHNGFDKQSIKIFFANGVRAKRAAAQEPIKPIPIIDPLAASDPFAFFSPKMANTKSADVKPLNSHSHRHHDHHDAANERPAMYPASLKIGLRNHIRTVCTTPHCADSLVIYLSSATRSDGASLLWDADNNGEYDETEVYTIREFLRDIQDCLARQVVVLADQNHSGLLADNLKRSKRHANVLMFTSSQSQQLSRVGEFTHHWTNYPHGHSCLSQTYKDSVNVIRFSTSRYEDSSNGTLKYNLFGAPCDAVPPYSSYELKSLYMGCQYVPTRLWLSRPGTQVDPPPRLLTGRRRR